MFTYDPEKLAVDGDEGDLHRVRFSLGDTDQNAVHLQDEEIAHLLSSESSFEAAVSEGAGAISARYSHEASYSVGPHSVDLSKRAERFSQIAKEWKGKASNRGASGPTPLVSSRLGYFRENMHVGGREAYDDFEEARDAR